MKKFLVLYRAPISAREQMAKATPEQAKAGMEAWMGWAKKSEKAIVDLGSPVGDPVVVGPGKPLGDYIGGFSILQAESVDALQKVLQGHAHLMMPGGSIEIREFLPMPGT
jgi:hypothetical protein